MNNEKGEPNGASVGRSVDVARALNQPTERERERERETDEQITSSSSSRPPMVVEICNYHHTIHIAKSGFNSIKRTEVEKERNPLSPAYLCSPALQHSNPRERMRERVKKKKNKKKRMLIYLHFSI